MITIKSVVEVQPTATLRDCSKDYYGKQYIVWGNIYGDTRGRWRDGTRIHTSDVKSFDEATQILHTLNSSYKIENWRE
jgi:hypothetical protein